MTGIRVAVPKSAKAGEAVELKALIRHPMESGFRRGSRGELIERNIITTFECRYLGDIVFKADLSPMVAANPFVAFHVRARTTGPLEFRWTDQNGEMWSQTAELTVT